MENKGIKVNEENYRYDNHKYFKDFQNLKKDELVLDKQNELSDGKTHNFYKNGLEEIKFANGADRFMFPNGYVIVSFTNGDVK